MECYINDNWKITTDTYNYILCQKTKAKVEGTVNWSVEAYCGSIGDCGRYFLDRHIKTSVDLNDIQNKIDEAKADIKKMCERFENGT